jgi:hypothetical protein
LITLSASTFIISSLPTTLHQQVEEVMKLSLRKVMAEAVESYLTMPRHEWVLAWPGQVVLASGTIHWSAEVTTVLFTNFHFYRRFKLVSF